MVWGGVKVMEGKNYTIELYRFIFTMFVVMGHLAASTVLYSEVFAMGGHSVDFFFLLSGFLMYQSFIKSWKREESILGYTINFIRKRIVRFAPVYYLCFVIGAVYHIWLYSVYTDRTALDILNFEKGLWPELFFLNSIYFRADSANSATWYLSALLIGTLILILLLTISDKFGIRNWTVLVAVFAVCFFMYYDKGLPPALSKIARSLYGLSLGSVCYLIMILWKEPAFHRIWKIIWNLMEMVCIGGIIYIMFFCENESVSGKPLTIFFAGLILFAFLQRTYISRMLNRKIFKLPGMLSYAIYVSHLQVLTKFGWLPGFDLLANRSYSYFVIITSIISWGTFMNYLPGMAKVVYQYLYGLVHAKDTIQYIRCRELKEK